MTTERGSYDDSGGIDAVDTTTRTNASGAMRSGEDRLGEAAGGVAERVATSAQETVGTQVDGGLTRAGDVLEQLAGAVRQGGSQLRGEQPQLAGIADTAAGQVERVARHLRDSSAQDVLREAEAFARRQPAVFLGSALALGLVVSRFLKASPGPGNGNGRRAFNDGIGDGFRDRYGVGSRGSSAYEPGGSGYGFGSGYGTTESRTGFGTGASFGTADTAFRSGAETGSPTRAGAATGAGTVTGTGTSTGAEHGGA